MPYDSLLERAEAQPIFSTTSLQALYIKTMIHLIMMSTSFKSPFFLFYNTMNYLKNHDILSLEINFSTYFYHIFFLKIHALKVLCID